MRISHRRRQSNKVFFSIFLLPLLLLLIPHCLSYPFSFWSAHTNRKRTKDSQSLFFCKKISWGEWKKRKENFLRYRFFSLSFFLLSPLFHFAIYTLSSSFYFFFFGRKMGCSGMRRESVEWWELARVRRKEFSFFLIQQMLVVYSTVCVWYGMAEQKIKARSKIFFNIKLYSFTSVDNSCFFILSFSLSFFLSGLKFRSLSQTIYPRFSLPHAIQSYAPLALNF